MGRGYLFKWIVIHEARFKVLCPRECGVTIRDDDLERWEYETANQAGAYRQLVLIVDSGIASPGSGVIERGSATSGWPPW